MYIFEEVYPFLENLGIKIKILYKLPPIKPANEILEHYYFDGKVMLSTAKKYAIEKDNEGNIVVYILHPRRTNPPLELIFWDQLLKQNATFIHASGIVRKGDAIIFPAWPETGKTSLIVALLKLDKSLMMLSDDYVILSASGDAYPYPRPFAVYSYHTSLFLDYFKKRPLDLFRLKMAHILKKFNIPYSRLQKTLNITEPLWIPWSQVFPDRLASKGKLKRVYLLTKTSLSSGFKITPVNLEVIIKHAYLCIIYDLLAPLMQDAIALTSFGFMNVFNDLQKHLEILRKSLKGCELYNVILPRNTNFNKIAVKILSHMADKME